MAQGTDTPAGQGTVSVSNAVSTEILAANRSRQYAAITNNSVEDVWVSFGATAVVGEGILIQANGGALEIGEEYDNLFWGAVNGINAGAGAVNVAFLEMV